MFTISVYQLVTDERQIGLILKNLLAFYGRNYDLSFPATPGTSCGLNSHPARGEKKKKTSCFLSFLQCDPHGLQIR